jgi:hypothetical protein
MGSDIVDGFEQGVDLFVADPALNADGALRRGRGENLGVEQLGRNIVLAESLQAGKGEQRRIDLAFGEFPQPCIDEAAIGDDIDIRAQPLDQRLAAQRGGADGGALRQIEQLCGGPADKGVAGIFARQIGGEEQAGWQLGRHVLGGMHGKIQPTGDQHILQFLGEKALAADLRQRSVGDPVAHGRQHDDLEHFGRQSVRRHQPVPCFMGLRQRQGTAPRADPERFCLHPLRSVVTGGSV